MSDIEPLASVRRFDDLGMLTFRGDLSDPAFRADAKQALRMPLPGPRRVSHAEGETLAWMAPDELLLVSEGGPRAVEPFAEALQKHHHLALDVSDARRTFELSGRGWRDLLAKGAPVDFHREAFGPGDFRRTRLGQIAAAFWCVEPDLARIIVARSVADFAEAWLLGAAKPGLAARVF